MRLATNRNRTCIALDGVRSAKDYFVVDEVTYLAIPLNHDHPENGMGINSTVFRAMRPDSNEEFIVKISNIPRGENSARNIARLNRFDREIAAYKKISTSAIKQWVVGFIGAGSITINSRAYPCIVLDKADSTLSEILWAGGEISIQQRFLICAELLRAVAALHEIGIYHRDLKPDNILFQDRVLKLVDLGLVAFREDDSSIDEEREKIGPIWWMAPEAINKCQSLLEINCAVGGPADVYQLGKLFWYILQGDIPNGNLKSRDMRAVGDDAYGTILKPLLSYTASDRPTLAAVSANMNQLRRRYAF